MKNYTGEDDYRIRTDPMSMGEYLQTLGTKAWEGLQSQLPEIPEHDMKMSDEGNYIGDRMPLKDYLDTTMPFTPAGDIYEGGKLALDRLRGEIDNSALAIGLAGTFFPIDSVKGKAKIRGDKSQKMADQGKPVKYQWKQNMAAAPSKFNPEKQYGTIQTPQNRGIVEVPNKMNLIEPSKFQALPLDQPVPLDHIYNDPDLFDADPSLKDLRVVRTKGLDPDTPAAYVPEKDVILINEDAANVLMAPVGKGQHTGPEVFFHELQHAVQKRHKMQVGEGFTPPLPGENTPGMAMFDPLMAELDMKGGKNAPAVQNYIDAIRNNPASIGMDPNALDNYRGVNSADHFANMTLGSRRQPSGERYSALSPERKAASHEVLPYLYSGGETLADLSGGRHGGTKKLKETYPFHHDPKKRKMTTHTNLDKHVGIIMDPVTREVSLDQLPVTNDKIGKTIRDELIKLNKLINP